MGRSIRISRATVGLLTQAVLACATLALPARAEPSAPAIPKATAIVPAVATSSSFSMALDEAGKVYAWGSDSSGQLGQGRPILQSSPVKIEGIPPMQHVSVFDQVLAVDRAGQVWAWADEQCPHLGRRESPNSSTPSRLVGVTGMKQVAAGFCQSFALREDGSVWQMSLQGVTRLAFPSGIVEISAGGRHLLARRNDGTVWAFGLNDAGQLGIGNTVETTTVVQVKGITNAVAISAGWRMSVALLANGEIRAWGRYSATLEPATEPVAVTGLGGAAIAVDATNNGLAAARADGTVWTWTSSLTSPVQAPGMTGAARIEYDANSGRELFAISPTGALTAQGGNNSGQLGQGSTETISGTVPVPGFSSGTQLVRVGFFSPAVVALKSDGSLWFWGANQSGQRGDAEAIGSAVPLAVALPATIQAIAASDRFALALDTTGRVWGWGNNADGPLGTTRVSASTPQLVAGIDSVVSIAAGGLSIAAFAKADGTAWISGTSITTGTAPRPIPGLTKITQAAAGINSAFFLRDDGVVFAIGGNAYGELGDGTTTARTTPVQVLGLPGAVRKIAAAEFRSCAVLEDGRVFTWGSDATGASLTGGTNVAVAIPGVTDAVDVAVSRDGVLIRRASGALLGVGFTLHADGKGKDATQPYPITFPNGPAQAIALGSLSAVVVGSSGIAWGWGANRLGTGQGTVGDGTFVQRETPVVLLAANGRGSLDGNDWFFDLQPSTAETVPRAFTPKALATARMFGGAESLAFDGTVRYKASDVGRRASINNYVVGLVPPAFFDAVKPAPGTASMDKLKSMAAKSSGFVFVQLTPAGWTNVQGQLIAYSSGTAAAQGSAANILNGISTASLAGSRFCIGYGESVGSMLSSESLREVLAIEGSQATDSGIPCVLSGMYVSGPPSSVQSSPVTFTASVVGIVPTGTVQFRDGAAALGGVLPLVESNPALATATLTTSSLAVGAHSIGASYSGGGLNAASTSEVPLLHTVIAPQATTRVDVQGPASSALGSVVGFTATVTGSNPSGTVQFRSDGASLGEAVPVVTGQATLRTGALALGTRTITASYSGDSANTAGTSAPLTHQVENVIATQVSLISGANPAAAGASVTVTATVSGAGTPTGSVTLRNGPVSVETKALAGGSATFVLEALPSGVHQLRADYAGDGASNTPASSDVLFQDVLAASSLTLSVSRAGSGSGTVTSSPAGINCGSDCAEPYASGTSVTLTASASAGSVFTGWSGGGCSGTGACTVVVDADKAVTATFDSASSFEQKVQSVVTSYYQTILGRAPDAGGLSFWTGEATRVSQLGADVREVFYAMSMQFFSSPEYVGRSTNNEQYIRDLYQTFFSRVADAGGLAYWVGELEAVQSRSALLNSFLFSSEFAVTMTALFGNPPIRPEVNLTMDLFRGVVGRLPDNDGYNYWLGQLRAAQCSGGNAVNAKVTEVANLFFGAPEYGQRARNETDFMGDVYNTYLRRGPGGDGAGFNYWVGQVAATSRDAVRGLFVPSAEFQARVAAIVAAGCSSGAP